MCRLDDLAEVGSMAATATIDGRKTALMIIAQGEAVRVYVNSCPHIGSPLDFTPGVFLNLGKTHIQCATHGALFTIEDGLCVKGPCVDMPLQPVAVEIRKGAVFLKP